MQWDYSLITIRISSQWDHLHVVSVSVQLYKSYLETLAITRTENMHKFAQVWHSFYITRNPCTAFTRRVWKGKRQCLLPTYDFRFFAGHNCLYHSTVLWSQCNIFKIPMSPEVLVDLASFFEFKLVWVHTFWSKYTARNIDVIRALMWGERFFLALVVCLFALFITCVA